MKRMKLKMVLIAALAATLFSACDQEAEIVAESPVTVATSLADDNLIRVSVADGMTRAGYTTSNLKEFGFFVNTPGKPDYTYNNVRMRKGNDGEWKPENGLIMQWWDKMTLADIVAYAPYQENEEYTISSQVPVRVPQNQSTEEGLMSADFIAMKWGEFLPWRDEEAGKIPVKLKHLMCKIELTIIYSPKFVVEEGINPIKEVRVGGQIYLNGICDFSQLSPTIDIEKTDRADIKPFQTGDYPEQYMATYECLVIPQSGNLCARITFVDGFIFIAVHTAVLKEGYNYEFVVRAIKKQV